MKSNPADRWISLVISLPGRRGTARMRIWRALKGAGAAVLRDGVYLLPDRDGTRTVFQEQARAVRSAGGLAHILPLDPVAVAEDAAFRALFDRGPEHAALVGRLQKLRATFGRRRPDGSRGTRLRNLRRDYEALREIDFFPGPAASHTREMLLEVERLAASRGTTGEPGARGGAVIARDPADYRGRLWATRARPWVDRLASAWLIRRFIDPRARFLWLADPGRRPKRALGFDFDGAEFTHAGSRVTFEVLAASFGLESDPALRRIGAIVHFLDVGGAPMAEAPGLAALLGGARERLRRDEALFAEGCRLFESLYAGFKHHEKE